MKKVCIYILAAILLFSFFREINIVKVLLMLAALASIFAIDRVPAKYIMAMKYPVILLSFGVTACFFFYPRVLAGYPMEIVVTFLAFYSLTFYMAGMEEKKNDFFKEVAAVSILFISSSFNLFIAGKLLFVLPLAVATMLLLFVLDKNRLTPFIAGYALIAMIIAYRQGINFMGTGLLGLNDVNRYILLGASFILLVIGFAGFMKKRTFSTILPFFGFLYIAIDIFMVLGLRSSTGLLYQPVILLAIVSPLVAMMLKPEGERL
ncbi:MAG TPA: hypothetical protein PLX02_06780 [Syntrophorhabdaceae bacterium]|nr:hypothetical protein [Syntrophorhabdaceae bacterium]HQM81311.1 hypothetical protein [Syntrophorhabdaceae bacterium]